MLWEGGCSLSATKINPTSCHQEMKKRSIPEPTIISQSRNRGFQNVVRVAPSLKDEFPIQTITQQRVVVVLVEPAESGWVVVTAAPPSGWGMVGNFSAENAAYPTVGHH
jgi:hypothetical protein